MSTRLRGPIRVVGAGLLGTSIGLALSKLGLDVIFEDASPANLKLAIDYGAGRRATAEDQPSLIVVCVPPDVTASVVDRELRQFETAVVTDVASVKMSVLRELEALKSPLDRYVGSHPMAGRERGGAIAGRADLFIGRPWVITPNLASTESAVNLVEDLATALGSSPLHFDPADHDSAVALVSHLPQLVSTLTAAQLNRSEPHQISLAGQGLRDTTRIAASDPKLWTQILEANATQVSALLKAFAADLDGVIQALENPEQPGSLTFLSRTLEAGNRGVERIPGKHGANATRYSVVVAMIDDKPGELARLLTEIGEIDVNLEDLKLEHSPGAQIGLVELYVVPEVEERLVAELTKLGWRLA